MDMKVIDIIVVVLCIIGYAVMVYFKVRGDVIGGRVSACRVGAGAVQDGSDAERIAKDCAESLRLDARIRKQLH